jgi:hypothetical protein
MMPFLLLRQLSVGQQDISMPGRQHDKGRLSVTEISQVRMPASSNGLYS